MASDSEPPDTNGSATGSSDAFDHQPVMLAEVVDLFASVPAGAFVDATLGGAGHASAVLDARPDLDLVGLDRDADALEAAGRRLAPYGDRVVLRHARFDELDSVLDDEDQTEVSGLLFDLGVSSPQFDRADRGFSYRADAPLDMRMDQQQPRTAAEVVNEYDEDELASVLARYGDERFAKRIARAIVAARPVATTAELADIVRDAIPAAARRRGGHPAKRSFQALRIEVNDELEVLPGALDQAIDALAPAGRCVVLAYHSGEDRIVKERFTEAVTGGCTCPPRLPCACGAVPRARWVTRRARPGADEIARNPRAASARLRAVEALAAEVTTDPAKVEAG
jgi:16S rRNA (cytosine1402-N4)-methyltransferase